MRRTDDAHDFRLSHLERPGASGCICRSVCSCRRALADASKLTAGFVVSARDSRYQPTDRNFFITFFTSKRRNSRLNYSEFLLDSSIEVARYMSNSHYYNSSTSCLLLRLYCKTILLLTVPLRNRTTPKSFRWQFYRCNIYYRLDTIQRAYEFTINLGHR